MGFYQILVDVVVIIVTALSSQSVYNGFFLYVE